MYNISENAQMALDTIHRKQIKGIPISFMNIMEHSIIERLAGASAGDYINNPIEVYIKMQRNIGVCMLDQFIPTNPLSMNSVGFDSNSTKGATTGAQTVVVDGIVIDCPEAVVEHMEGYLIPSIIRAIKDFDETELIKSIITEEHVIQQSLGPEILKCGYGHLSFPVFHYGTYGYENYFCAYALYPEVINKIFTLQGELSNIRNKAVVKAYISEELPLYQRLDFDMADSRGLLVNVNSLEHSWVPSFMHSIKPAVDAEFTLLWHCDGNLMKLIPYLIEAGVNGFQGFQYEDGMDYIKISNLKAKNGQSMVIEAGVSVTRELPMGTPDDIVRQLKFLVENGPKTGLFLSLSSSCTPWTPFENIKTAIEGMQYYKKNGRR